MKFDFWLKRQGVSLKYIIEKNDLKTYEELVRYCENLRLSPPVEKETEDFFMKSKKVIIKNNKKPITKKPRRQRVTKTTSTKTRKKVVSSSNKE